MADKHTIENWGERLNIKDEPLTIEQAMLLNLGHLNARLELLLAANQDMQMRLQRLEMFAEDAIPGYGEHAERIRQRQEQERQRRVALAAGRNGGHDAEETP